MTPSAQERGPRPLAIQCAQVLDVRSGSWHQGELVVIRGNRIEQVGGSIPTDAALLDLGPRSLMPGLIDGHTHVLLQGDRTPGEYAHQLLEEEPAHRVARATKSMRTLLARGFTTARDLGTEGAGFADVALREAQSEGVILGPQLVVAGPGIARKHTYQSTRYRSDWPFPVGVAECEGVDGCRAEVRRQIAGGVNWIKIYANGRRGSHLTPDGYIDSPAVWTQAELQAMVDEAHASLIPVAAHATSVTGTEMAVAVGVDSIEHGYAIPPDTAEKMAEGDIALIPTLAITHGRTGADLVQYRGALWENLADMHIRALRNCVQVGVRIAFGTDAGGISWDADPQGSEFDLLVGPAGLEPIAALRSATLEVATVLGLAGIRGEVAEGQEADLIAGPGDPLQDIRALRRVDVVIQQGELVGQPQRSLIREVSSGGRRGRPTASGRDTVASGGSGR